MTHCEQHPIPAPNIGCGCHACYHARKVSLDPRLLDLAFGRDDFGFRPSRQIAHGWLARYFAGQIEHAALHVGLIEALAQQLDQQFEKRLEAAIREPVPVYLPGTAP
jgi:hypothetical protein